MNKCARIFNIYRYLEIYQRRKLKEKLFTLSYIIKHRKNDVYFFLLKHDTTSSEFNFPFKKEPIPFTKWNVPFPAVWGTSVWIGVSRFLFLFRLFPDTGKYSSRNDNGDWTRFRGSRKSIWWLIIHRSLMSFPTDISSKGHALISHRRCYATTSVSKFKTWKRLKKLNNNIYISISKRK